MSQHCECVMCYQTNDQMFNLHIKTTCMSVCLSIRPGPETHIPKKTHTFSFQVSRNEGSVCLGTWGRGRAGQGRADTCPLFQLRLHLQTDQMMIEFK